MKIKHLPAVYKVHPTQDPELRVSSLYTQQHIKNERSKSKAIQEIRSIQIELIAPDMGMSSNECRTQNQLQYTIDSAGN